MANLILSQFEKFKPPKMKPEIAENEKKNFQAKIKRKKPMAREIKSV